MELEELTLGSLRRAVYDGDVENGSVMAGQIAGLVTEVRPVKNIIEDVLNEVKEVLNRTGI